MVRSVDPTQDTIVTRLSEDEQLSIQRPLGQDEEEPYNGCLNEECLDQGGCATSWHPVEAASAPVTLLEMQAVEELPAERPEAARLPDAEVEEAV